MTTSRHRKDSQAFNLGQPAAPDGSGPEVSSEQTDATTSSVSEETSFGKIEVSPKTISHIASRATQQSYGVVGLTSRHARPGWAELLRREEEYKGVVVKFSGGRVIIDLYVVIEYGTRISEVARNIMSSVKFAVESALGVPVVQVNVNVQNIRVSK